MNSNPEVVAAIGELDGFFFGGGDQQRIIYSLYNDDERQPSPVLTAIKARLLESGGVVAGTSAGTDCQTSHTMISGGVSYGALLKGATLFWRSLEMIVSSLLCVCYVLICDMFCYVLCVVM